MHDTRSRHGKDVHSKTGRHHPGRGIQRVRLSRGHRPDIGEKHAHEYPARGLEGHAVPPGASRQELYGILHSGAEDKSDSRRRGDRHIQPPNLAAASLQLLDGREGRGGGGNLASLQSYGRRRTRPHIGACARGYGGDDEEERHLFARHVLQQPIYRAVFIPHASQVQIHPQP